MSRRGPTGILWSVSRTTQPSRDSAQDDHPAAVRHPVSSVPTNGSSTSCTSSIWPTLSPSTRPGTGSSRTTGPSEGIRWAVRRSRYLPQTSPRCTSSRCPCRPMVTPARHRLRPCPAPASPRTRRDAVGSDQRRRRRRHDQSFAAPPLAWSPTWRRRSPFRRPRASASFLPSC